MRISAQDFIKHVLHFVTASLFKTENLKSVEVIATTHNFLTSVPDFHSKVNAVDFFSFGITFVRSRKAIADL